MISTKTIAASILGVLAACCDVHSSDVPDDTLGGTWCEYSNFATCSGPYNMHCIDDWLGECASGPNPFTVIAVPTCGQTQIDEQHIAAFHEFVEESEPMRADVTGDGTVNVDDILAVLNNFGGGGVGDVTCTGQVTIDDLEMVLNHWSE